MSKGASTEVSEHFLNIILDLVRIKGIKGKSFLPWGIDRSFLSAANSTINRLHDRVIFLLKQSNTNALRKSMKEIRAVSYVLELTEEIPVE